MVLELSRFWGRVGARCLLMNSRDVTSRLRESVWNGSIPLEVRLHNGDCRTYDESDPYMV